MKNLFLLFTFLVISSITGLAQNYSSDSPVTRSGSVPSTCTAGEAPTVYGADIYICVAGTRYPVSTTAAGGSISGLTATRVPVAASATTLTNYAGFTHDGTTLTVAGLKDTALTSGRVLFATTGGGLTDSSSLNWDDTNKRGAIGTTTGVPYALVIRPNGSDNNLGFYTAAGVQFGSITYGDFILSAVGSNALDFRSSTTAAQPIIFSLKNSTGFIYFRDNSANNLGYFSQNTSFAAFNVLPPVSTQVGQVIKLAIGQSADAFEVQDSTTAILTRISSAGDIYNVGGGTISGFRYFANGNSPIDIKGTPVTFTVWNGAAYVTGATLTGTSLLGVGVSPSAVVHAYTTGSTNQFIAERNTGTAATTGKATILHSQIGYTGGTGADSLFRADWGWGFQVNNQSSPVTLMTLTNSELVGIGITNPTSKLHVSKAGEALLTINNSSSTLPNVTIGIGSGSGVADGQFFFHNGSVVDATKGMFKFVYGANSSQFVLGKAADTASYISAATSTKPLSILDNLSASTADYGIVLGTQNGGAAVHTSGQRTEIEAGSGMSFTPTSGTGTFVVYQIDPTINQTGGASGITRGIYVNPTLTAAADWRGLDIMASYVNTSGTLVNVNVRSDFNAASASSATPAGIQSDTRTQGAQNYTSSTGILGIQSLFTGYGSGTVTWVRGFRSYIDAYQATLTSAAGVYVSSIAASGTGSVGTKYGIYLESQSGGTTANYSIYTNGGVAQFIHAPNNATSFSGTVTSTSATGTTNNSVGVRSGLNNYASGSGNIAMAGVVENYNSNSLSVGLQGEAYYSDVSTYSGVVYGMRGMAGARSGTISSAAYAVTGQPYTVTGSTVAVAASFFSTFNVAASTVTNLYGLYLTQPTAGTSTNYQIYSVGGASLLNAGTSTVVPLTLKGAASQSGDLTQWQNSSGTVIGYVNASGDILGRGLYTSSGYGLTNSTNSGYGQFVFNASNTGTQLIVTVAAANILSLKAASSQTGNYLDFQNSSGTSLAKFDASANFFAGPSTIESFTTNASALGTLNYYTDSQTIYYDTAAATADVTINVDASASVDLNTRLATGQMVTVVLAITNTGTAYKCNTLQVHSVGQTIKWVGGAAPTGNINAVDWYTFTIMKTGASTYYVTGSQTSYK